jgi:hypothetical protein
MILVHKIHNNDTTAYVESSFNCFFHFFFQSKQVGGEMKFHFPPTHPPSLSLEFSPYSPRPKSGSFTRFLLLRPSETAARSPSLSLSLCPDMPPYSPSPKSVSGVPLRSWVVSLPPLLHRSSPPSVGNRRPQPLSLCHTVPRPVYFLSGRFPLSPARFPLR